MFVDSGSYTSSGNPVISNSVRLRSGAPGYFQKTLSTPTNNSIWTWSGWVKRGSMAAFRRLFTAVNSDSSEADGIRFDSSDRLDFIWESTNVITGRLVTTAVYRDPSAWMHIVLAVDTTQATAANRFLLYVNGVQVTSFGTATYPAQNASGRINSAVVHRIGIEAHSTTQPFDGVISRVCFVDGSALTASSFGAFDSNGFWYSKSQSACKTVVDAGGTNSFMLDFDNTASTTTIGYDKSSKGNNWTSSGLSTSGSTTDFPFYDVPANNSAASGTQPASNYCVLNAIEANPVGTRTISDANLTVTLNYVTGVICYGNMVLPTTGKYYWEVVNTTVDSTNGLPAIGVFRFDDPPGTSYDITNGCAYRQNGNKQTGGGVAAYGTSFTTNDVIGVAVDMDNGAVYFSKNGTWQNSGDPTSGATKTGAAITSLPVQVKPGIYASNNTTVSSFNFGQRPFTYTPPTGFKSLCTANLGTPAIANPAKHLNVLTYTGNGGIKDASLSGASVYTPYPASVYTSAISNSLRLRKAGTAYISKAFTTPTNANVWTVSLWVKRGEIGTLQTLLSNASGTEEWYFDSTAPDQLYYYSARGKSGTAYKDPSRWYHVHIRSTGSQVITSVDNIPVITYTGTPLAWNTAATMQIGKDNGTGSYLDATIAHFVCVDGQALTPDKFGTYDSTFPELWKPLSTSQIRSNVGTFGANGAFLLFNDSPTSTTAVYDRQVGDNDTSKGTWTLTNIGTSGTSNDWLIDSPTTQASGTQPVGNYATLNPLWAGYGTAPTFSEANLKAVTLTTQVALGNTPFPNASKSVVEATVTAESIANSTRIGIRQYTDNTQYGGWVYVGAGAIRLNDVDQQTGLATFGVNDVIRMEIDLTANTLQFYKNNTAIGTACSISNASTWVTQSQCNSGASNTSTVAWNYGQRTWNNTPTSGYKALCTSNLTALSTTAPPPFTGLAIVKNRSSAASWQWVDFLRGAGNQLASNSVGGETTTTQSSIRLTRGGIMVGNDATVNTNSTSYVANLFGGFGSPTTNTAGSQTSIIQVNSTAGISTGTYSTPASGTHSVGHGLGVKPAMIISKAAGTSGDWIVGHKGLSANMQDSFIRINLTNAASNSAGVWGGEPTSTLFYMTTSLQVASTTCEFIAFAEIPGFSKFGSYTANNSTDGPFCYTGFTPKVLWIKNITTGTTFWLDIDTGRDIYNLSGQALLLHSNVAEYTPASSGYPMDILSNGFKQRATGASQNNATADTYIYAAFAGCPIQYAGAR